MNIARTCQHVLSAVVAKTRGTNPISPAEDLFLATALQRLEESARMVVAIRRAAVDLRGDDRVRRGVLPLDGHRISRYTGAHITLVPASVLSQRQGAQDVHHTA